MTKIPPYVSKPRLGQVPGARQGGAGRLQEDFGAKNPPRGARPLRRRQGLPSVFPGHTAPERGHLQHRPGARPFSLNEAYRLASSIAGGAYQQRHKVLDTRNPQNASSRSRGKEGAGSGKGGASRYYNRRAGNGPDGGTKGAK